MLGVLVLADLGIDEEDHRHVDALPAFQRLLGEAEAFDLAEILAGLGRGDVEHRFAGGRAGDEVGRAIEDLGAARPARSGSVCCTGSNRHGSAGLILASNRTPISPATAPGALSARSGVPPKPVTWQNKR